VATPAEADEALAAIRRLASASHVDASLRLLGQGFWHGASCTRFEQALLADKRRLQRALRDAEALVARLRHPAAAGS
jgi:hypothetical protein